MLLRLDVGADSLLQHLVIDDGLILIAIQGDTVSRLVLCHDNEIVAT